MWPFSCDDFAFRSNIRDAEGYRFGIERSNLLETIRLISRESIFKDSNVLRFLRDNFYRPTLADLIDSARPPTGGA